MGAGVCEWSVEMDHVGFLRMTNKHILEKELLSDFGGTRPTNIIMHCTKNPIYVFPELQPCGIIPSEQLFPKIGLSIWLQQNRHTVPGNIYIAHRLHECGNWETEYYM